MSRPVIDGEVRGTPQGLLIGRYRWCSRNVNLVLWELGWVFRRVVRRALHVVEAMFSLLGYPHFG